MCDTACKNALCNSRGGGRPLAPHGPDGPLHSSVLHFASQVNEYKYEMERITRELQDAKRKHYEHKRREQVRASARSLKGTVVAYCRTTQSSLGTKPFLHGV